MECLGCSILGAGGCLLQTHKQVCNNSKAAEPGALQVDFCGCHHAGALHVDAQHRCGDIRKGQARNSKDPAMTAGAITCLQHLMQAMWHGMLGGSGLGLTFLCLLRCKLLLFGAILGSLRILCRRCRPISRPLSLCARGACRPRCLNWRSVNGTAMMPQAYAQWCYLARCELPRSDWSCPQQDKAACR